MKNKLIISIILFAFINLFNHSFASQLTANNSNINKTFYSMNKLQWYKDLYNDKYKANKLVKIAFFGEEIIFPNIKYNNMINYYDPYLNKNFKPKEKEYITDSTKSAGIIYDLNSISEDSTKAKYQFNSVNIYKKGKTLTSEIFIKSLNWAKKNKINIILIENSLILSYIDDKNKSICNNIKKLSENNIAIVTLAGSELENTETVFKIEDCQKTIKISPLTNKFTNLPGFYYSDNADFALPSEDFIVYKPYNDIIAHKTESNPIFASALFTYILSDILSSGLSLDKSLNIIKENLYQPDKNNNIFGYGIIDFNNIVKNNMIVNNSPVISSFVSDGISSFTVNWNSPLYKSIDHYYVTIYKFNKNKVITLSTHKVDDKNAVRLKIDHKLNHDNFITLTAVINNIKYESLPTNDYIVEDYKQQPDPFAQITEIDASWVQEGILVNIKTNIKSNDIYVNILLIDGWTQQVLFQVETYKLDDFIIRVDQNSDKRSNPHFVLASLNNKNISIPLYPEYTLSSRILKAGNDKFAVSGSTEFACVHMDTKRGCVGSKVNIIDQNGNIIASTKVLLDNTFNVIIDKKNETLIIFATIEGTNLVSPKLTIY